MGIHRHAVGQHRGVEIRIRHATRGWRTAGPMFGNNRQHLGVQGEVRHNAPRLGHGGGDHIAHHHTAVRVAAPRRQVPVRSRRRRDRHVAPKTLPAGRHVHRPRIVRASRQVIVGRPLPRQGNVIGEG